MRSPTGNAHRALHDMSETNRNLQLGVRLCHCRRPIDFLQAVVSATSNTTVSCYRSINVIASVIDYVQLLPWLSSLIESMADGAALSALPAH